MTTMHFANRVDRFLWAASEAMRRWPSTVLFVVLWLLAMALWIAIGGAS